MILQLPLFCKAFLSQFALFCFTSFTDGTVWRGFRCFWFPFSFAKLKTLQDVDLYDKCKHFIFLVSNLSH